jgi:hypothetical protein
MGGLSTEIGCAMVQAGWSLGSQRGGPSQSMWNLWWTKWHWDRFSSKFFGFQQGPIFICDLGDEQ